MSNNYMTLVHDTTMQQSTFKLLFLGSIPRLGKICLWGFSNRDSSVAAQSFEIGEPPCFKKHVEPLALCTIVPPYADGSTVRRTTVIIMFL